jgi:type 1 fimbria pilin
MTRVLMIALVLTLALSAAAFAAGLNPDAKVAVHVRAHSAKAGCTVNITGCGDIVTTEPGYSIDAFTVFFDLAEFLGRDQGHV